MPLEVVGPDEGLVTARMATHMRSLRRETSCCFCCHTTIIMKKCVYRKSELMATIPNA